MTLLQDVIYEEWLDCPIDIIDNYVIPLIADCVSHDGKAYVVYESDFDYPRQRSYYDYWHIGTINNMYEFGLDYDLIYTQLVRPKASAEDICGMWENSS